MHDGRTETSDADDFENQNESDNVARKDGGGRTVFKINTDGSSFGTLHGFNGTSDGAEPIGALRLIGSTLYGVTCEAGTNGYGTAYKVTTGGSFSVFYSFAATDGATPEPGYVSSVNNLYGGMWAGGPNDAGTIFSLSLP